MSDETKIKIDDIEIETIKNFIKVMNQIQIRIGVLHFQKQLVADQLESSTTDLKEQNNKYIDFIKLLENKYGPGNLSLETYIIDKLKIN